MINKHLLAVAIAATMLTAKLQKTPERTGKKPSKFKQDRIRAKRDHKEGRL